MNNGGTKPRREDLCKKFYCSVKQDTVGTTRYLTFPMQCKSWNCPDCRKQKAANYRERMTAFFDGRGLWLYTLTYFHNMTPAQAWGTYNESWNRLRTNLKKRYGSFNFVRVLESHKNSPYPHLHIIADVNIRPTDLGPAAIAAGFGYQLNTQKLTTDRARAYVTKYLTKEWTNAEGWNLRKNYRCRLISFSRGLLSPVRRSGEWQQVIMGTDFENCLDHIRMDYEWRTDARGRELYSKIEDDFAEVTIIWEDVEPGAFRRPDDDWQPDDWLPK